MSMTTILTPSFMVCPETGRWVPLIERNASHSLRLSLHENGGWKISDTPGEGYGVAFLREPLSRLKAAMAISRHGDPIEVIDYILDNNPHDLPLYLRPQWSYPVSDCKVYFDYQRVSGICKGLFNCEIVRHNPTIPTRAPTRIPDHRINELALWMHSDNMLYEEAL